MAALSRRLLIAFVALLALAGVVLVALAQGGISQFLPFTVRSAPDNTNAYLSVNFQPAGADIPDGYQPDYGWVFGGRASGHSYGWNADNSATTRERNSSAAPDQRYDTFIHLQKQENPDAVWELAVPNGLYEVNLTAGDPDFYDGVFAYTVEGVTAVAGSPNAISPFVAVAATVTVSDGRLTIRSGPGAVNNKLSFIDINFIGPTPLPQPSPSPTATATDPAAMTEFRGLWVTRFDWTNSHAPASPAVIDTIIDEADQAGFNALLFQVRGTADAFYTPGLEPWAQRVSAGGLGQPPNPSWDPLAYFVERAHARGMQVHAYVNVYPVWNGTPCDVDPGLSLPAHLYYKLRDAHGTTDGKPNALMWTTDDQLVCGDYRRASPASQTFKDHFVAVTKDLVTRYQIDGVHLDHVRYAGATTSCDPVSEAAFGESCFPPGNEEAYKNWQRSQINGLVSRVYSEAVVPGGRKVWLSAAVWPIYRDYWGWGVQGGYDRYYQDSQAWLKGGYADALMPMIYPAATGCLEDSTFWTRQRWETLVAEFQLQRAGRYVVPGIGSGYCDFGEIVWRIDKARSLGTAGHALFSYGALKERGFFDDLAAGPYAQPANVPDLPWHN